MGLQELRETLSHASLPTAAAVNRVTESALDVLGRAVAEMPFSESRRLFNVFSALHTLRTLALARNDEFVDREARRTRNVCQASAFSTHDGGLRDTFKQKFHELE